MQGQISNLCSCSRTDSLVQSTKQRMSEFSRKKAVTQHIVPPSNFDGFKMDKIFPGVYILDYFSDFFFGRLVGGKNLAQENKKSNKKFMNFSPYELQEKRSPNAILFTYSIPKNIFIYYNIYICFFFTFKLTTDVSKCLAKDMHVLHVKINQY